MSKIFFSLLVFVVSSVSMACPDLSGEYIFADQPWMGKRIVKQQGCESMSITRIYKNDPEEFTVDYKTDGQAYQGRYQSELALPTDDTFHIATFTEDGVSVVDYWGSQDKCSRNHAFNNQIGNCKKAEIRLEFDRDSDQFVWREIGYVWWDDGWRDETFPLRRK